MRRRRTTLLHTSQNTSQRCLWVACGFCRHRLCHRQCKSTGLRRLSAAFIAGLIAAARQLAPSRASARAGRNQLVRVAITATVTVTMVEVEVEIVVAS